MNEWITRNRGEMCNATCTNHGSYQSPPHSWQQHLRETFTATASKRLYNNELHLCWHHHHPTWNSDCVSKVGKKWIDIFDQIWINLPISNSFFFPKFQSRCQLLAVETEISLCVQRRLCVCADKKMHTNGNTTKNISRHGGFASSFTNCLLIL